ncbi:O-methyltransferase [Mycena belliarum]|uniref:O-methyltransferase n=1 Tax=Mycena belliarum TaxID=1033014 RepID=A0AAD6TUX4_9AGAR|nr:O-methyltransferase [Mycena belliae]
MTLAVLRALHAILGDALNDIERVYSGADPTPSPTTHKKTPSLSRVYASPPPSPSSSSSPVSRTPLDFPSLDAPYDPASPSEQLTTHPAVVAAINRIVAAAGQMAATVQVPFLTLCDAGMGYHLPSCLRLLEAAHIPEILRDGPVHVREIAARTGVEQTKLAHILRLLATHHLVREVAPDVFATNRICSLIDTGKPLHALLANPERKYDGDASGVAAFVGLCCDELHKSSAYLTEAVFPGAARVFPRFTWTDSGSMPVFDHALSADTGAPSATTPRLNAGSDPTHAPFNYAFGCGGVGYFGWLEGEGWEAGESRGNGGANGIGNGWTGKGANTQAHSHGSGAAGPRVPASQPPTSNSTPNPNRFRLERFGKAMAGTGSWEAPGAVLHGFDWGALPQGSVVVDVGGGIGSTSMLLASAYAELDGEDGGGLRFVIQDRPVVVEMGKKAWSAKCPELLESGAVQFQVHDFFRPQPVTDAAVFLLRVVLHDWPDAFAQRILLRLREAAAPHTRLLLADFVLPLACVDDFGVGVGGECQRVLDGPHRTSFSLLCVYATLICVQMQVTFNGQERTLRETVALALSAGWKVVRVTKAPGSLFGHIVAVPTAIPQRRARAGSGSAFFDASFGPAGRSDNGEMERASSRCGTPTFGSRVDLPSVAEARARFGGSVGVGRRPFASGSRAPPPPVPLKQAAAPQFRSQAQSQQPLAPSPVPRQAAPPSPMSPRHPLSRRSSYVNLSQTTAKAPTPPPPVPQTLRHAPSSPVLKQEGHQRQHPSPPSPFPARVPLTLRHAPSSPVLKQPRDQQHRQHPSPPSPVPSRIPTVSRRASHAQLQLPQTELRKRSGSIIHPAMARAAGGSGGGMGLGSLLLHGRASGGALDFGAWRRGDADGDSESADDDVLSRRPSPVLPARSVLAAAARIERGIPRSPSLDP